jgi:hypothetical protein
MNATKLGLSALLLAALCGCHEPPQLKTALAAGVIDETDVDFGQVPVGEWRDRDIHVRNVGDASFNALEALKVSGDASFFVELDPGRVKPGETRAVRVRFHPLKEGGLSAAVRVQTDADKNPEPAVPVHGTGGPSPVRISPATTDFQNVEVDSDRTLELTIENPVDIPMTAIVSQDAAGEFGADTVTVPPSSTQVVRARFFPRSVGSKAAQLEVRPCEDCTPATSALTGKGVASALVFDPAPVPFDNVPVHEVSRSVTQVTNITWRPIQVEALRTTDPAFSAVTALENQTIGANQSVPLELEFAARHDGPMTGTLHVDYQSNQPRAAEVGLDATGGRPALALAPVTIDFGSWPVGAKYGQKIRLSNAGTRGQLHFQGVRATGDLNHFSISPPSRGPTTYPWSSGSWPDLSAANLPIDPGSDYLEVTAYFQPDVAGPLRVELIFRSDDLFNPERSVILTGEAYPAGPCTYQIRPYPLEFGNVPAGNDQELGFQFTNTGNTICAVRDIHLSNTGGGVFFLPGGDLAGGILWPTNAFSVMIGFRAPASGSYDGELQMTVNTPSNPIARLPIHAVAQPSCLVAAPNHLDFGPVRLDCRSTPLRTLVSNQCVVSTTITGIEIGPGTSDQFSLVSPPATPIPLAPGNGVEVGVSYTQRVLGQHYSPLWFHVPGEPAPFLVALWAETALEGFQVDRFIQGIANQLDVLFVLSNTTTMGDYQSRLKAAVPGWISTARARGVDIDVGVTSTGLVPRSTQCGGGARGGENGRLFPIDGSRPRIVASSRENAVELIQQNIDVGTCHNLEQGLEAMRQALSSPLIDHQKDPRTPDPNDGNLGLLRAPAQLAVVILSDEDDHSGFDPISYGQFIRALKGAGRSQRSTVSAIVPTDSSCVTAGPPGPRFTTVAQQTGGLISSVCSGSYGSLLDGITNQAAGPQREFRLSAVPSSPSEITVTVDGQTYDGTRWSYDAVNNSVVFALTSVPNPGQEIDIRYRSVCP